MFFAGEAGERKEETILGLVYEREGESEWEE